MFDDISDYVLWKRKMKSLLVQQKVHGAINSDNLPKKPYEGDKEKN